LVRPIRLPVRAIACGALLCGLSSLFSQSPSSEPPRARLGVPVVEPVPADVPLPQSASATVDRQAVQKIVREEMQAEKGRTATDKSGERQWTEVGKDRGLRAIWDNGFVAETADQSFRIHLGGRLEFDNSWFTQDNNLLLGSSPDQRMQDGTLMRRARLR